MSSLSPRMGHSSILYKESIIIFGGMKYDQSLMDELIVIKFKDLHIPIEIKLC